MSDARIIALVLIFGGIMGLIFGDALARYHFKTNARPFQKFAFFFSLFVILAGILKLITG